VTPALHWASELQPRLASLNCKSMTINFHDLSRLTAAQRDRLLQRTETDLSSFEEKVRPIIAAVRTEGDEALARFAREFDKAPVKAGGLAATEADFAEAEKSLAPEMKSAMEFAAGSIRKFHAAQMPGEQWLNEIRPGVFAGERTGAIPSAAIYVPRGKGAFPSVVLMTAIPASVAGVHDLIIVTPPGPTGKFDDATLVAARMAGVSRIYKAGGAQAIAAVAYGTRTIPKVAKVVGPGSPWVAAAKRQLSHIIDTGSPAGPSEVIIFADDTVDGRLAALDLLVESEHGPDSSAYIVTASKRVADEALMAIPEYWTHMSAQRSGYSQAVLGGAFGGIILAPSEDEAIAFCNDYAPEHLEILSKEPFRYLGRFKHAGEILLGEYTPTTLGNFVIGPSHVLPTSGWAKTASPVSVHDFLKRTSLAYVTSSGYPPLAQNAKIFAEYETFDGHANAVSEMRDAILRK
jgi:histidinol dehydrogenase